MYLKVLTLFIQTDTHIKLHVQIWFLSFYQYYFNRISDHNKKSVSDCELDLQIVGK